MQPSSPVAAFIFLRLQKLLATSLFLLSASTVEAQGLTNWNLYGNTESALVPFTNTTPLTPGSTPTLSLRVGGGSAISFGMDTGSTGIAISSTLYTPGANDKLIGSGATQYSSSGLQYNGNVYQTTVNINGAAGTVVATSVVDVLVVTGATCYKYQATYCPGGINTPPVGVNTTNIHYAGIGFAAGNGFMDSAIAASATNPFTNIVTIGGHAVTTNNYVQGYVITPSGVNLGLTSSNTSNFAYVKLGSQPNQADATLWARAAALITTSTPIPGGSSTVSGLGHILTDSGVGEMIISPAAGSGLVNGATPNPGTVITVNLGGQSGSQNYYSFTVGGNAGTPQIAPTTIEVVADTGIFVNTGRLFLNGFNYLYDPTNGFVGYSWTNAVSGVPGQTTPSIQFQCDVGCNFYMPNGFSTNLPAWLGSDTTFTALGHATLTGVISGSSSLTVDGPGALELAGQNTYTGTTMINPGSTLYLTGSGAIASSSAVMNSGTFDITGANGNIALGGTYAQSSTGKLSMNFSSNNTQQLNIANSASLGGSLNLKVAPGYYVPGKYTIITAAGGVAGAFNIWALSSNLANYSNLASSVGYDSNNVYYNILPSTLASNQTSVATLASALAPIFTLQNSILANSFTYDCPVFGENNVCVSAGGRNTAVQATNGLNSTSALLIAAYRAAKNVRFGGYADQNLSVNNASTGISLWNNTPLVGLFGVWSENLDGTGSEVKVSAAYGQKNTTITRQVFNNTEPGSGSSTLNSQGAQVSAKYGFGITEGLIVSPYVGMRYTQNNLAGYVESASSGVSVPLTYLSLGTSASTALFGIGASYKGIPKTTLFMSAGLETSISTNNGLINAAGIIGLTPVTLNPDPVNTRSTTSVGAYYDIQKNQRVGITGIYRQESYQAVSTTTVMTTYTVGI